MFGGELNSVTFRIYWFHVQLNHVNVRICRFDGEQKSITVWTDGFGVEWNSDS